MGMLMSQDDLARAVGTSKRLVQRWEAGTVASPRPTHARALEAVTGLPIEALGFSARVRSDGAGGHEVDLSPTGIPPAAPGPTAQPGPQRNHSGVWLSRYEYFSSGRGSAFTGVHYVVLLQHGDRLTVRSLPGSADSSMSMDLTVAGNVVTGTWVEETAQDGYYRGARYHGAIQMLAEPTGRRMVGKWVGFGKEMDVNTGPWELIFQNASTSAVALEKYNRPPESDG